MSESIQSQQRGRITRIAVFGVMMLCLGFQSAMAFPEKMWVITDKAPLKSDRKATSETLAEFEAGTEVTVLSADKLWRRVRINTGLEGYMYYRHLTPDVPAKGIEATPPETAFVIEPIASGIQTEEIMTARSPRGAPAQYTFRRLNRLSPEFADESGIDKKYGGIEKMTISDVAALFIEALYYHPSLPDEMALAESPDAEAPSCDEKVFIAAMMAVVAELRSYHFIYEPVQTISREEYARLMENIWINLGKEFELPATTEGNGIPVSETVPPYASGIERLTETPVFAPWDVISGTEALSIIRTLKNQLKYPVK